MKVKLIGTIKKDGTFEIGTIKGAGGDCKRIADLFAGAVGTPDEGSRGDTDDLNIAQEGTQDLTVNG